MSHLIRSEPRFFAKTEAAIYALENFHMRTWRMLADVYGLEPAAAMVFLTICLSAGRPGRAAAPQRRPNPEDGFPAGHRAVHRAGARNGEA